MIKPGDDAPRRGSGSSPGDAERVGMEAVALENLMEFMGVMHAHGIEPEPAYRLERSESAHGRYGTWVRDYTLDYRIGISGWIIYFTEGSESSQYGYIGQLLSPDLSIWRIEAVPRMPQTGPADTVAYPGIPPDQLAASVFFPGDLVLILKERDNYLPGWSGESAVRSLSLAADRYLGRTG